jgi:hypothetical protein
LGHRRSDGVAEFIRPVRVIRRVERLDTQINFRQLEPERLEVEVEGELREFFELKGEARVIPRGALSEFIVGEEVGPGLGLSQMVETDDWDSFETKELCGLIAPMTGDDLVAFVD